eukprot:scaffold86032_cov18-Prasinocladus_malaysianus.AAC.1
MNLDCKDVTMKLWLSMSKVTVCHACLVSQVLMINGNLVVGIILSIEMPAPQTSLAFDKSRKHVCLSSAMQLVLPIIGPDANADAKAGFHNCAQLAKSTVMAFHSCLC